MTDEATPEEIWAAFIISRKNQYLDSYRSDIGREYNSNAAWWDSLAEREWEVIEERLRAGFGVEQALKAQLGEDFFERQLLADHNPVDTEFAEYEIEGETHKVYTISDFLMLSNQGIFRDSAFLIDKERKWEKKTIKQVEEYGYIHAGFYPTNEITFIIFAAPEGEL